MSEKSAKTLVNEGKMAKITMNERYSIGEEGITAYEIDGKTAGYKFYARHPYYFGIPLSQIKYIRVYMDGIEESQDDIRLIVDGDEFKMNEIVSVASYHWPFGKKIIVAVCKDDDLAKGMHRLRVDIGITVIYIDEGFVSNAYLDFEI